MPTRIVDAKWLETQKRWQVKVQANGVRKTFTSSIPGRAGKAEANKKADDWLASALIDSSALVSTVWAKWVASLTSKDAIAKAQSFWRLYISSAIGKKRIGKITEGDLQAILDGAVKRGMAWKSVANIRGSISCFIKWARKNQYTAIPTSDLTISKNAPKGKKVILQPDDIIKLWNANDAPYKNLFRLAVLTGLRPGELLGLQWADVKDNRIFVRRAINYKGEITNGKNENASRIIWMSEYEIDVLGDQRKLLKHRGIISPWIFPKRDGEHAKQCAVARSWEVLRKKAGITPGITPYGWRHTFISINNDMPEGLKRRRVGHAMNMDTEGVYGHEIVGEDEQAAAYVKQRFDVIFQKPTQKPT